MTKTQTQLAAAREKAANEAIDAHARGQVVAAPLRWVPAGYLCGTPGCPGEHRSKWEVCSE